LNDIDRLSQSHFSFLKTSMEWDDFKYLLAVARTGSLSAAAQALKTSAATVGRRIATLETRLGARMFDRSQSGYALTESGEAIRQKAEEVEEAVLSLEREAFGRDLRASGKVRLATAEDIATFIIAPKLPEFRKTHPGIMLELVSSWDVANLTRREADIALRTARPTHGDYVIRQIGTWNCALYVSKSFARANKLSPKMANLPNVDVITWTEEHRFRGGDWLEKHAPNARAIFAANSRHVQYAACKAGLGAAILPCVAADRDPDLIQIMSAERVRSVPLWLVAHRDLLRTARVRAVMDLLVEIAPT
jgi:DNA-binding transcriptional LysR family regulator